MGKFTPKKMVSFHIKLYPMSKARMLLSKILPQTSKKFTQIYLPYLWHYATLAHSPPWLPSTIPLPQHRSCLLCRHNRHHHVTTDHRRVTLMLVKLLLSATSCLCKYWEGGIEDRGLILHLNHQLPQLPIHLTGLGVPRKASAEEQILNITFQRSVLSDERRPSTHTQTISTHHAWYITCTLWHV